MNNSGRRATMVSNTSIPPGYPGAVTILAPNNSRKNKDASARALKQKAAVGRSNANGNANKLSDLYWKTRVIECLGEQNGSAGANVIGKYLQVQPPSSLSNSSDPSDPSNNSRASNSSLLTEIKARHGSLVAWMEGHADTFLVEKVPFQQHSHVVHLIGYVSRSPSKKNSVEPTVSPSVSDDAGDDSREKEQPRRRQLINGETRNPHPLSVASRSTTLYWMKLVREFLLENENLGASSGNVGSYLNTQPPSSAVGSGGSISSQDPDARRVPQSALREIKDCHGNLASWVQLHRDELIWQQHPMNEFEFMIRLVKGRVPSSETRPTDRSTARSKSHANSNSNSRTTAMVILQKPKDPQKTTTTPSTTKSNVSSSLSDRADYHWKSFLLRFLSRQPGATTTDGSTTMKEIGSYLEKLPSFDGRSPSALTEFKTEQRSGLTFWLQQYPELFVVDLVPEDFSVYLTERGMQQAMRDAARADIAEMKTRMQPNLAKQGGESNNKQSSTTTSEPTLPVNDQAQRELGQKESQLRQSQEALSVVKAALEKAEHERDDALRLLDLAKSAHHAALQSQVYEREEKERLQLLWGDSRNQLGREKETVQNLKSELDGTSERLASTIISREVLQNRLRSEQIVRKEVEAELLKLMNHPVRNQDSGGSSSRLVRVKNELQQTQDKLAREKEKNRSAIVRTQEVKEAKLPELSDWMGALNVRVMQRSDVPVHVPEPMVTTPTLSSVSAPSEAPNCAVLEPTTQDSAINFGGLDDFDGAEKDVQDRLDSELIFVMSSYGDDELYATNSEVVRFLDLNVDQDSTVRVNLTLTIPIGYPATGTLDVKAEIDDASTSGSTETRKFASDYLLFLVNVCQWEANVCLGDEALLTVLTTADQWIQNEWAGIRTKHLGEKKAQKDSEAARTFEICRLLVYSHHITEPEKIQLLKSTASKSGLGGFVRIGRPGFVLVEGLEENCDNFMASIIQSRKKKREKGLGKVDSAYFSQAAKVLTTVSDFEDGLSFSKKITQLEGADSLDELKQICEEVGLAESLEEACKR